MSQKWEIKVKSNDNSLSDTTNVTLKNLTQRSEFSYDINFSAIDNVGCSECEGILIHKGDNLSLHFVKLYNDMKKAGQTSGFETLIYSG